MGHTCRDAVAAATLAAEKAEEASGNGTFGVGGLLLGPSGEVLTATCNRVLVGRVLHDSTAHGERQIVDWYFQQLHEGRSFPPPEQLTIVSSLDPCMMCTGSVLSAGMNVVVLAPDQHNGVNYLGDGGFTTLPEELREQAGRRFSYLGVEGGRDFQGSSDSMFSGARVPAELEARSAAAFAQSWQVVKKVINASPAQGPETWNAAKAKACTLLREVDPQALSLRTDPLHPGPELGHMLLAKAEQGRLRGAKFNAAALLDPEGVVLLCLAGQEQISPIRSPFMELTRAYCGIRGKIPELPHFKQCRLVTLLGPGRDGPSIADIGAYGSFAEGPLAVKRHWQYLKPRQSKEQLDAMVAAMPPLWSREIGADFQLVENQKLRGLSPDSGQ